MAFKDHGFTRCVVEDVAKHSLQVAQTRRASLKAAAVAIHLYRFLCGFRSDCLIRVRFVYADLYLHLYRQQSFRGR